MISEKKIVWCTCERCGHKWQPKTTTKEETIMKVKVCPKCKSPYWNMPKKTKKKALS